MPEVLSSTEFESTHYVILYKTNVHGKVSETYVPYANVQNLWGRDFAESTQSIRRNDQSVYTCGKVCYLCTRKRCIAFHTVSAMEVLRRTIALIVSITELPYILSVLVSVGQNQESHLVRVVIVVCITM